MYNPHIIEGYLFKYYTMNFYSLLILSFSKKRDKVRDSIKIAFLANCKKHTIRAYALNIFTLTLFYTI